MATYIFQKIADEGKASGFEYGSETSRDWFRDKASEVGQVNLRREMTNRERLRNRMTVQDAGRMYMFFYDPKHKATLPYYDRFPLIFMVDKTKDGFTGLNLHYLPPLFRARLMDRLYSIEMNDAVRQSKKLKLTYGLLSSAAKFSYFKPTFKRYLNNHVRSRFLYVPAEEWDIALMLPTERFKKAKTATVYKDSRSAFGSKGK
jgi:hypothetical protein